MPIYSASQTDTDFDGSTAALGLFDPAAHTGSPSIQVKVNSITFSGPSALTDWTISLVDPSDSQTTVLLTDTTTTQFVFSGPVGLMLLPTNSNGVPWNMTLVTNGLTGTGTIKIDFDFENTSGG